MLLLIFLGRERSLGQDGTDDDSEFWTAIQVAVPLGDKTDLILSGSFRVGRDFSHPVYENVGGTILFRLGRHFTVAPFYQFVATQYYPGVHTFESRLAVSGTASFPWKRIVLSDTQVFEERFRELGNSSRYRNRVQVEWPFTFRGAECRLFAADEVFYDWRLDAWNRNRLYLGGGRRFSPRWGLDLFFLKQNSRFSAPRDINAVGVTLRIKVDRPLLHFP